MPATQQVRTELSERSRGWLRYLYRKATTPDNWDKGGKPLDWWDDRSGAPMTNFCRFDLLDSSLAIALMADTTPAWREVYSRILDELVLRHTSYWAAIDWLTQIGDDPKRGEYPEAYRVLIPPDYWGRYNVPGWTANGIEPWGLEMDPIGAQGNLFFKGFFNLVLGLHRYVSGDEKWNAPFDIVRDGENSFTWSYHRVSEHLAEQWLARPEGCHCENTKVWPFCLTGAGLGLLMHDKIYGTSHHLAFTQWWEHASRNYMSLPETGPPEWVAMYYDPVINHLHKRRVPDGGLGLALYLAPQKEDVARRLYDWWAEPLRSTDKAAPALRGIALALALTTEFGDQELAARLAATAEEKCEPIWEGGEFYWGFGLQEEHPRGQYNAMMMAGEAGSTGAWRRLFNQPNLAKFRQPSVEGVDFPTVGVREAYYDPTEAVLRVSTDVGDPRQKGRPTSFRVTNLASPGQCQINCDGAPFSDWCTLPDGSVRIFTDVRPHRFTIADGSKT